MIHSVQHLLVYENPRSVFIDGTSAESPDNIKTYDVESRAWMAQLRSHGEALLVSDSTWTFLSLVGVTAHPSLGGDNRCPTESMCC